MAEFVVIDDTLSATGLVPGSIADSISKWKYLLKCAQDGKLVYDGNENTCALCQKYDMCFNCPIYLETGEVDCWDTPHGDYYEAVASWDVIAAATAAEEMVEFLENL